MAKIVINIDALRITPAILSLIAEIDEFKGAWQALGTLAPERLSALRRVATIEIELEAIEGRLSQGGAADLDTYTRASGHLRRILETLGIERAKRDVAIPTLAEYLRHREAAE